MEHLKGKKSARREGPILGDPGADSGDEEKSKRAEKYMARRKVKNGEKSSGTSGKDIISFSSD